MAATESLNQDITVSQVPYTDLKSHINRFISCKWQERWSSCPDNTLLKLRPPLVSGYLVLDNLVKRNLFYHG